jgi:hypothetical protein
MSILMKLVIGFTFFKRTCSYPVFFKPFSDLLVFLLQQVLANNSQEMEMAYKISFIRKHCFYGKQNPFAHVMNQGNRISILLLYLSKKYKKYLDILFKNYSIWAYSYIKQ